jgi:glutaredoxin
MVCPREKERDMRFVLMAMLALAMAPAPATAAGREPQVYFFWAASCQECQSAREFLDQARADDANLQVRDFEVENNLGNAILLSDVYARVGLFGIRIVPLIVIGTHVVIGYDDAVRQEILDHISDCRKHECRDIVHDLIREPNEVEQAALANFIGPPVCGRGSWVRPR